MRDTSTTGAINIDNGPSTSTTGPTSSTIDGGRDQYPGPPRPKNRSDYYRYPVECHKGESDPDNYAGYDACKQCATARNNSWTLAGRRKVDTCDVPPRGNLREITTHFINKARMLPIGVLRVIPDLAPRPFPGC